MHTHTRRADLRALGLDPPRASPAVVALFLAHDTADAVWSAWIAAVRVWPMAWLAVLDAAAGNGR